jgi:DNA topoisomerase VI subunit A
VQTPGSQVHDVGVRVEESVELEEYDLDLGTWSQYAKPRSGAVSMKKEEERGAFGFDGWTVGGQRQREQGYVSEEETVNCFQSCFPSQMMDVDEGKPQIGLDLDVSREEVIRRIETMVHFVINCLIKDNTLPVFEIDANPSRRAFRMDSEKSLLRFARMNNILNHVHKHLISMEGTEHRFTQRDLYYSCKVKDPDLKPQQLAELVQDASQLLRVPRYGLGIDCSGKGVVSGPMFLYQGSEELEIDCSDFTRGYQISGSVAQLIKSRVVLQNGACCIVIVEKESVFQRLVSISSDQDVLRSCIFVTARGYPDIATRVLLNVVKRAAPCLPMVGLVDWNPHGLNILCQYRYGSAKSLESQCFALGTHLKWLGMRMNTMREIFSDSGEDCFRDLSSKDRSLAASIRGSLKGLSEERWISEIDCMEYAGVKADIESIYSKMSISSFGDLLGRMILKQDWV